MKNNTQLSAEQTDKLRSLKLLGNSEFAYVAGDLIVAENPVTGERRMLGRSSELLTEGSKRVLKG